MSTIATDYMELALELREASPEIPHREIVADVREMILASRKLHRFAEDRCNRGLSDSDQQQVDSIQARMIKLLTKYSAEGVFNEDPRGSVFKIRLSNGRTNDFGQEGWCVPR